MHVAIWSLELCNHQTANASRHATTPNCFCSAVYRLVPAVMAAPVEKRGATDADRWRDSRLGWLGSLCHIMVNKHVPFAAVLDILDHHGWSWVCNWSRGRGEPVRPDHRTRLLGFSGRRRRQ